MPFTQISLRKGKSLDYRRELMEEVYLAMRESINTPENDRFATITELEEGNFNTNLGIRKEDVVISLLEISPEDWSLGNGDAQYA